MVTTGGDNEFVVVGEASDAVEAVSVAAEHQPDIVLLDLLMPGADGVNVIGEIAERCRETRILVLSGLEAADGGPAARAAGAHGYLVKGASRTELLAALRKILHVKVRRQTRILMAEDDPTIREMYQIKLEQDGWDIRMAPDGEAAVGLAQVAPPDLVLLDMQMPKLDGIGVLKRLREHRSTRDVPVVVLSNTPATTRMEDAYRLGIVAWLVKSAMTPKGVSDFVRGLLAK